jgi:RNA polymerase sigma-70 factor, ECF subfamily
MQPQKLDEHLITQFKAGNQATFNLLVLRYQHKIIKLVGRYVKDPSEVMDVAQETFIRAYRALPNFRGASSFYTWLFRIAINTAKNHEVAKMRRPPCLDIDIDEAERYDNSAFLNEIGSPESHLCCDQLEQVVSEALDNMPAELRQAMLLRELEGLSYEEISSVMSCPIGTVRSRIFRAREMIGEKIQLNQGPSSR